MMNKLISYARLLRLHRPIGILLLLWPTLWGLWFAAEGWPPLAVLLRFIVGTVLMRSAGCAINDWADQAFDREVKRTRDRPLVTGTVTSHEALGLALILTILAATLIIPYGLAVWGGALLAVAIAASYPFTKRFLAVPQAYLGIAFACGIPMGFLVIQGSIPVTAWALCAANLFWCIAYDTEYAMVDRDDDLRIGIRTAAITFGRYDVLAIMLCYVLALLSLIWVGGWTARGPAYYTGVLLAAVIAGRHFLLIRTRSREGCFAAFQHNNWFGAVVFAGVVLDYL